MPTPPPGRDAVLQRARDYFAFVALDRHVLTNLWTPDKVTQLLHDLVLLVEGDVYREKLSNLVSLANYRRSSKLPTLTGIVEGYYYGIVDHEELAEALRDADARAGRKEPG